MVRPSLLTFLKCELAAHAAAAAGESRRELLSPTTSVNSSSATIECELSRSQAVLSGPYRCSPSCSCDVFVCMSERNATSHLPRLAACIRPFAFSRCLSSKQLQFQPCTFNVATLRCASSLLSRHCLYMCRCLDLQRPKPRYAVKLLIR